MFTSIVFTAVVASSAVLLSNADVSPNEPGPGEVFNEGTKCHIGWGGDTASTTAWKNMAIELMTGPNEAMVHLTTVTTGQDGTVAGTFDYDCPEVAPNSPIYFYQFSAPGTDFQWTTRFTIAGADGSTTNATQSEQANGQTVFFGTGALADPSTAVPPPTFNGTSTGGSTSGSSAASGSSASAGGSNSASNAPSGTPSGASAGAGASAGSNKSSGSGAAKTSVPQSSGPSNSASAPKQSGSSAAVAVGPMVLDTRVWPFVAALTACATAFTILL